MNEGLIYNSGHTLENRKIRIMTESKSTFKRIAGVLLHSPAGVMLLTWLVIIMISTFSPAFAACAAEEERAGNSWIYENGNYLYTDAEGQPVKNQFVTPSDGHSYWLDENGILQYGVFTVNGMNYTADATGWVRFTNGWLSFDGKWAASDTGQGNGSNAEKRNCRVMEGGLLYFIDGAGERGNEVLIIDSTPLEIRDDQDKKESCGGNLPYRLNEEVVFPEKPIQIYISGGNVNFPGWVRSDDGWYLSEEDGSAVKDTIVQDAAGKLFRLGEDGKPAGGLGEWDKKLCWFRDDGSLSTEAGWIEYDGTSYYVNQDGAIPRNEVFQVDGSTYFAGNDGRLTGGFRSLGGKRRFFDEDGKMRDKMSWINYEGSWYFVNADAEVVTGGPLDIGGKKYYFSNTGEMLTGRIEADDLSFYYADDSGEIYTGQDFTLDGISYHADDEGRVFVGTMYEKAQSYASPTYYLIMVNLATQRTAVFEGSQGNWRLMREMIVSTGAPINPTPKGEYYTTVHSRYFNSYGVRAWYATGFIGGLYLFHSSPYEIASEPLVCTDPRLGIAASHGCVRMALEDAKWMFDNLPLRTKVVIYEE